MDHAGANEPALHAEELLRLLAAASTAVRLYPDTSPMRMDAINRFAEASHRLTAQGPIQMRVDRGRFLLGEHSIGSAGTAIAGLAETLHALQVGQLIIAPGVAPHEAETFLRILGQDSRSVRASGGIRQALLEAGVSNIAVVEVTLRASTEEGLAGLDLTSAPLEEIGEKTAVAAHNWARAIAAGETPFDEIALSIERLEAAARGLATRRVAEALLRLDEDTRIRVLESALVNGPSGTPMNGLLDVIAHMPAAALARLLRLTAERTGAAPDSLAAMLELPPEVARELAALLAPSPASESEQGVPFSPEVEDIAAEVAENNDHDQMRIEELMRRATKTAAAARALRTTVLVTEAQPSEDGVRALGDAVTAALRSGAYDELGEAFRLLQQLSASPELATSATAVRTSVAEEVIEAYAVAAESARDMLATQVSHMSEALAPVAARILRGGDPAKAASAVRLVASVGDKRLTPMLAQAVDHLDIGVRTAAIEALADTRRDDSTALLEKALSHWDPETRRIAAREIGRAGVTSAVPTLLRMLEEMDLFKRNYDLKKEILNSLERLAPASAIPVVKKMATRRFVWSKKGRELRYRARRTLELLEARSTIEGSDRA
ncbi:MAG: HEAT repeat domain-containing protein [Coriobacteriales bacterium]|nr:HEAT repeat domain-containing protein [Actinomycetes bacterium]